LLARSSSVRLCDDDAPPARPPQPENSNFRKSRKPTAGRHHSRLSLPRKENEEELKLACHNKLCSFESDHTDNGFHLQQKNNQIGYFFVASTFPLLKADGNS